MAIDQAGFERGDGATARQARAPLRFKLASGFDYVGDKTRFTGY